jgi:hemoglobin
MQLISHLIGLDTMSKVISDFYDAVQLHPKLREPFGIVEDWTEHKAHITHFWWTTLGGKPYRDRPYQVAVKHAEAGFTPELLVDWLALFRETLDRHLPKELADQWYARAAHIGRSLVLMHEFQQQQKVS